MVFDSTASRHVRNALCSTNFDRNVCLLIIALIREPAVSPMGGFLNLGSSAWWRCANNAFRFQRIDTRVFQKSCAHPSRTIGPCGMSSKIPYMGICSHGEIYDALVVDGI